MSLPEKIVKHIQELPEPFQAEVLDFVEYLESKIKKGKKMRTRKLTGQSCPYLLQCVRWRKNIPLIHLTTSRNVLHDSGRVGSSFQISTN